MSAGPQLARAMWQALETLHMTVYFAPEPRDAYRRAGLLGGWVEGPEAAEAAELARAAVEGCDPVGLPRTLNRRLLSG